MSQGLDNKRINLDIMDPKSLNSIKMKRILSIVVMTVVMMIPVLATPVNCVEPKGPLQGTINNLEAQGWTVADISCQQVYYLVHPTPPYVNRIVTVRMHKVECPTPSGPCILLGTATFTADEVVLNNNGNTNFRNVSTPIFAL